MRAQSRKVAPAFASVIIALLLSTAVPAQSITPVSHPEATATSTSFIVFDGLLLTDKPNLERFGMPSMRGTGNLWRNGIPHERVDLPAIQDAARFIRQFGEYFYIDIEEWPVLGVSDSVANDNVSKLIRAAEITRGTTPSAKFGIYGVMPQIVYWAIVLPHAEEYAKWRASNERVASLASKVDFVLPSLYTFYEDQKGWEQYASEMLQEARRYGKPVYAFLWPQYHDSNEKLRGRYLPADFWRFELEFCRAHADGVVLWGGYGEKWNDRAPWWIETQAFLKSLERNGALTRQPTRHRN